MRKKTSVFVGLIALLLTACGEQPYYEKVVAFDNREWNQNVKPSYSFVVTDINQEYDFTLSLRTSTEYKYSNLWIFMKTVTPDGTVAREPFELKITDESGAWIGEKSGSVVTTPLTFRSRKLPKKGKYTFTIEQGITQSKVKNVHDLTFRVEISNKEKTKD